MTIKGLLEKLHVTDEQVENLRRLRFEAGARRLAFIALMLRLGKNPFHGVNHKATAKRRAANKRARAARKANRR